MHDHERIDEALGITRCVRCGHRLDGEVECPFCSIVHKSASREVMPKWIYVTACFLTSPLSIWFILRNDRLTIFERLLAASGAAVWFGIYWLWA